MGVDPVRITRLTEGIIGCCIDVHRELGPGLLESVYEECLCIVLHDAGFCFERQSEVPVQFRDRVLPVGFRLDLLVEGSVVVELKAVEQLLGVHQAQVLTYLRLARKPVGLLCNFNVPVFKQGLKRLINPAFSIDLRPK